MMDFYSIRVIVKTMTFLSAEHSAHSSHSHAKRHAASEAHSHRAHSHPAESSSHKGVVAGGTGSRLPIAGIDAGICGTALDSGIYAVPVVEPTGPPAGSSKGVVAAATTKGRIKRSAAESAAKSAAESGVSLAPRVAELLVRRCC